MDRRDFLSAILGAAINQAFPPPVEKPNFVAFYVFQLSDQLDFGPLDEATATARNLKNAIEDEGVPDEWREIHRLLATTLGSD